MKSFINKILDQPQSQPAFKFVPQIKISPKSTLHLQIQPNDPHTASNIVINAFQSKANRSIVPIKVQWSRYKIKSDEQFTIEKIPSVTGNTYMCEPSDLGSVIQVKVKCLDQMLGGEAQATIGPVRIDPMLKRLIDGALYNESLLSQVIIVEADEKLNVNLRMGKNVLEFTDTNSTEKLTMPYSFSQPKIQLSPKDPCKVYLRFEQDSNNTVRNWLNKVTGEQKNSSNPNMNQSSLSIKVPHSNVSSMTSKTKLFQRSHVHCVNKLQVRFLSRNSRDLFLFTLRAFICKQDMKNSTIMQRIETLQTLKSQQDYTKFLQYISLKSEIIRLAEIAKQLEQDRNSKLKDIQAMQENINETTSTYLKIIHQKSLEQHVDLEQSYSMISMKREEIMGRKNVRELKAENEKLKTHVRQLNEQLELQRFFKKDANQQSMVFNQTANPFMKKQNISGIIDQNQSASYYVAGQEVRPNDPTHKNVLEISKSYLKVLQENKKLKEMSGSKRGSQHDKSMGIENLLESLHQSQEEEKRMQEMQSKMHELRSKMDRVNEQNNDLLQQNASLKQRLLTLPPLASHQAHNSSNYHPEQSLISNAHNNTSMISNSYMSMNQSMTSEAQLVLLQKKLIQLSNINAKFQSENTRLRRERDYFRSLYDAEISKVRPTRDNDQSMKNKERRLEESGVQDGYDHENSVIVRLKQDRETLQNEKNALMKKIDSLTRESNAFSNKSIVDSLTQKRIQQLTRHNQRLIDENQSLKKTIQNIKSFHDLQKRQLLNSRTTTNNPKDLLDNSVLKQQTQKLKKVNASLLNEIKQLKIQIEKNNDHNLDNSRVIDLQNQLNIFKSYANSSNNQSYANGSSTQSYAKGSSNQHESQLASGNQEQVQRLITQLSQVKRQNQRLRQQISTLQLKIKTQTTTIQKLMTQLDELHSSHLNVSNASSTFNKKYLTPQTSPTKPTNNNQQQTQRYKKKLAQLQAEVQILRRNSQAVNRSRDLSMSMMGYEEQRLELYKKENEGLQGEIDNLNKMCSKYSKDAREANLQVSKLRAQIVMMNKQRLEIQV